VTSTTRLAYLLAGQGPLLLDFDGPVCKLFAGYSAASVADELCGVLQDLGVEVPDEVSAASSPLTVLRWTASLGEPDTTRIVENALCAAELHAVRTAAPTLYAREVIVAAKRAGKPLAIVSNNSAGAVVEYLTANRLSSYITSIVGRAYADPGRMKPNPEPVLHAVFDLGAEPLACVLIGDSVGDIEGAKAAGVPAIGYANRPEKEQAFAEAKADAVVTSLSDIAVVLICNDTE
jgi:HAD superfamily hydrolase (TIGR01549 family)